MPSPMLVKTVMLLVAPWPRRYISSTKVFSRDACRWGTAGLWVDNRGNETHRNKKLDNSPGHHGIAASIKFDCLIDNWYELVDPDRDLPQDVAQFDLFIPGFVYGPAMVYTALLLILGFYANLLNLQISVQISGNGIQRWRFQAKRGQENSKQ